jgi:type II secretory pathway pseudopilin PulG
LLELLVVISILAIILSVGSQAMLVSMQSGKVSGERDVATALANEALEAVRAITEEKWQNLYNLTGKGATHYFASSTVSAGKWTLTATSTATDELVVMNGITYTRYVIVDNVSRDASTRAIETTYVTANDDPSTQKVTVTVSWPNAEAITIFEYFFRWRNKVCSQTSWAGSSGSGTSTRTCGTTDYDTIDAAVSTSTGTLELI